MRRNILLDERRHISISDVQSEIQAVYYFDRMSFEKTADTRVMLR